MAGSPVLIVEDESVIRELLEDAFAEAGFVPITATTGAEALSELHAVGGFAALVTDIRLPGIVNGWQVGSAFRERHPEAPIVFVTGYPEEAPLKAERVAFMRKPFKAGEVVTRLQELRDAPSTQK